MDILFNRISYASAEAWVAAGYIVFRAMKNEVIHYESKMNRLK